MGDLARLSAEPLTLPPGTPRYRPAGQSELGGGQDGDDRPLGATIAPARRVAQNLAVLRALQQAQATGEVAEAMQRTIAGWSGWGALPQVFDRANPAHHEDRETLRALLDDPLLAAAERTTINAHYTDADFARAMWHALRGLGFSGGQVLEPGSGSGNFIGVIPEDLLEDTHVTGVELDAVTANVSRALYPDATIRTESFADTPAAPGSFDAVIGNVPFGQVRLHDPRHNRANRPIHDHFILKAVDLTRPGGTIAVLTSRHTLDKADDGCRRAIFEQADLVGAVRLPRGAHRRAAGTEVVTDVLVFHRRHEGQPPGDDTWLASSLTADGLRLNDYFTAHPEHVLGTMGLGHGMHGPELVVEDGDLASVGERLHDALGGIATRAREAGMTHDPAPDDSSRIIAPVAVAGDPSRFTGFIQLDGDDFTQVLDGRPQPLAVPASRRAEMRSLLQLRDTTLALLDEEAAAETETPRMRELRARLNTLYDAYTRAHGPINRVTHRRTGRVNEDGQDILARVLPRSIAQFGSDPFSGPVRALEQYDEATGTATKAAIFRGRVLERREQVTSADTPADALAICLDQQGHADLATIAALLGTGETQARGQLGTLVYDDPDGQSLVPAAEYLSGNVRAKLEAAQAAAENDERYEPNVAALAAVVPTDLAPEEIHASLGAVWIPETDVQDFLRETLDDPTVDVAHGAGAMWKVTGDRRSIAATSTWGTDRLNALDLTQRILQQQELVIRDEITLPGGEKARVVNAEATDAAAEKGAALRDHFAAWVWDDPARAERLATAYNAAFNSTVLRSYDGEHLTLPGLAAWFTPHPHQRAAVHRIISEPAVGLFHQVGAGKTAEMVMGTQELRRLGMVNKPAIVVPNHMLEQFTREYLALYPRANILAAGTEDLQKDKRRLFVAKAATGDWDAIIMTRGAFQSIPVAAETERAYSSATQDTLRASLARMADAEGASTRLVKRMQVQLANAEEALKRKLDQRRDEGLTFEQLGIDYLMVDELHDYKNMRIVSSIQDAAHEGAQRAIDLDMKIDHLRRTQGHRVFTGATATPIANSVAEAYVMQRYVRPDLLEDVGLVDFDSWAATFGETVTQVELAPEGGGNYRTTTRFARFRNVPELLRMWHISADVKTAEDLPYLSRPLIRARRDGQRLPETVLIAPTEALSAYVADLGERAERVRGRLVDPTVDNMLKISGDGRAAALDMRLVGIEPGADALFAAPTKIETAAARIHSIWQTHRHDTYTDPTTEQEHPTPGSLQLVFCDLGTPTGATFNVYEELRTELAGRGMDPARVRFIHEAKNDRAKAVLFEQCRTGQVDVLIGSTAKMGVGTNIQARAVALHHLDCPWRPADIEQREGRILRQGNLNPEVGIYRYAVEGSFDAYSWQTVERKARFIDQIMRGTLDQRDIEDLGDNTLSYNEVKAIASGDPLVLERAETEQEVATLTRLERAHARSQAGLRSRLALAERESAHQQQRAQSISEATTRSTDTAGDAFRATIEAVTTTERPVAASSIRRALTTAASGLDRDTRPQTDLPGLVVLGGHTFDGTVRTQQLSASPTATLTMRDLPHVTVEVDLGDTGHGVITRLENAVAGLPERERRARTAHAAAETEIESIQAQLGSPFARSDELSAAKTRLEEIDAKMAASSGARLTSTDTSDSSRITPAPVEAPHDDAPLPRDEAVRRAREVREGLAHRTTGGRQHDSAPPVHDSGPTRGMG